MNMMMRLNITNIDMIRDLIYFYDIDFTFSFIYLWCNIIRDNATSAEMIVIMIIKDITPEATGTAAVSHFSRLGIRHTWNFRVISSNLPYLNWHWYYHMSSRRHLVFSPRMRRTSIDFFSAVPVVTSQNV